MDNAAYHALGTDQRRERYIALMEAINRRYYSTRPADRNFPYGFVEHSRRRQFVVDLTRAQDNNPAWMRYAPTYRLVREARMHIAGTIRAAVIDGRYTPNRNHLAAVNMCALLDTLHQHGIDSENAVTAWNAVCAVGDELVLADCGHHDLHSYVHDDDEGDTMCNACHEQYLAEHEDDDDDEWSADADEDEDEDEDDEVIRDYSDNVLYVLRADSRIESSVYGDFLMGIELEVAPTQDRNDVARNTLDDFDGYAILKNDGSLDNLDNAQDGFEIVTAPRGLAEHVKRFTDWTPDSRLIAWDAECCGMHVHIDSRAFTQATLGKFIEFINRTQNTKLIREIAGRHPSTDGQAEDYCKVEGAIVAHNPKQNLKNKSTSRYHMINTTNLRPAEAERLGLDADYYSGSINTVELRIFRATLNKRRLLAQIEFAHAAIMFCRWTSMRELGRPAFLKWLHKCAGQYPHLARWYGVRENTTKVERAPEARTAAEV